MCIEGNASFYDGGGHTLVEHMLHVSALSA